MVCQRGKFDGVGRHEDRFSFTELAEGFPHNELSHMNVNSTQYIV